MKLSVSAYRAHASAHKKILSSGYHSQLNYGSTGAGTTASSSSSIGLYAIETHETSITFPQQEMNKTECNNSDTDVISPTGTSSSGQDQIHHPAAKRRTQRKDDDQISNAHSSHSDSKSPSQRSLSSSPTTCSHNLTNKIFATKNGGNNLKESSQIETRTTRIKNYTERDRLTVSNHSSFDYSRPHVKLLFNSPSSEILNCIVHSGTSNSLNSNHQTKLAAPALIRQQIQQNDDVEGDEKHTAAALKNGTNQKWKNVKAVMAYYCTLRRIKRNGPFSIISKYYDSKDMLFKYLVLQSKYIKYFLL